jgi:uncharacterized cupredoxin-like copper-binding protein/Spy/CpxP family protein refolding chaperone
MNMSKILTAVLACAFAVSAAAQHHGKHGDEASFGRKGDPKKVTRTIEVDMSDTMRFAPAELTVKQGETIRFRAKNSGKVMHEMVLGTMAELKKHADDMKNKPDMHHDAPHLAHVAPGKTATLVWQFTKPGEFHYACLVPGHFEAGMVGRIRVVVASHEKHSRDAERDEYRAGAGMGYAKAAELNHFPGPLHVLELGDKLGLSAEQRAATKRLMDAHKAEARRIGAKLVDAEHAIEAMFRGGAVNEAALAQAVRQAAALEGEYRLAHLETHRRMRALLTDEQVARYDKLRGYR